MAAAAVATVHSCIGGGHAGFKSRASSVGFISSISLSLSFPCKRTGAMRVRCQAENKETTTPITASPATPTPPPKPKVSTKFSDVLAFSGPAPERINGRLAMIGFIAALGVEFARGDGLTEQLTTGGVPWFIATSAVLSAASLIPLFKGVSVQSKSEGLMNANAEMWNGRFAMLGLVALAFTEFVKGGPLV